MYTVFTYTQAIHDAPITIYFKASEFCSFNFMKFFLKLKIDIKIYEVYKSMAYLKLLVNTAQTSLSTNA